MENKDFRLGNYIIQNGKETIVYSLERSDNDWDRLNGKRQMDVTPVPITEEKLLKLGFEKIVYDSEETGYGIEYHLALNSRTKMIIYDDFSFGIENSQLDTHWLSLDFDKFDGVHHLQNIWYALTKEELRYDN